MKNAPAVVGDDELRKAVATSGIYDNFCECYVKYMVTAIRDDIIKGPNRHSPFRALWRTR